MKCNEMCWEKTQAQAQVQVRIRGDSQGQGKGRDVAAVVGLTYCHVRRVVCSV